MIEHYKVGDRVRLSELPPWVEDLPEHSQAVFRHCVGRTYSIQEIDQNGLLVLQVGSDVDSAFGGVFNDIRVEAEYVRPE